MLQSYQLWECQKTSLAMIALWLVHIAASIFTCIHPTDLYVDCCKHCLVKPVVCKQSLLVRTYYILAHHICHVTRMVPKFQSTLSLTFRPIASPSTSGISVTSCHIPKKRLNIRLVTTMRICPYVNPPNLKSLGFRGPPTMQS